MTYNEALAFLERIKDTAIGVPVKGRLIESLSIAPTNWKEMVPFMNLCIQKGEEAALIEFSSQNKSLSVYGVSVTKEDGDISRKEMTILDSWELILGN